ncbi:MAG: sensory rhodopsin transducer [Vicinamibacterales bacterium]
MRTPGRRRWVIAEGRIPESSTGADAQAVAQDTMCVLNAGPRDAHLRMTVFFADREPAGPYYLLVPARRTRHVHFDELAEPEPLPRGVPFASTIDSDAPIVVQHTRLEPRQPDGPAMMSVGAFPVAP